MDLVVKSILTSRFIPALCIAGLAAGAWAAEDHAPDGTLKLADYWDYEEADDPRLSPDGTTIIYSRRYIDELTDTWTSQLWMVDSAGTYHRFLAEGSGARWSPAGDRIAYVAKTERHGEQIFVQKMPPDAPPGQVSHLSEAPQGLLWSPDGSSLLFRMFVPGQEEHYIRMPAAPEGADWTESPMVTERLHYKQDRVGYLREGFSHLFVVPADGGKERQITRGNWNAGNSRGSVSFDWSPDGNHVVFDGEMGDTDLLYLQSSINIVDVRTGEARNLTPGRAFWSSPAVSPDGNTVAYTGRSELDVAWAPGELWLMNIDGTGKRQLTTDSPDTPADIRWSPDGNRVLFEYRAEGHQNLHQVTLNGDLEPVTTGAHVLDVTSMSREGKLAATRTSAVDTKDVVTFELDRPLTFAQLTDLNADLLHGVSLSDYEEIRYDSSDGSTIQGWIVKPPHFDSSKDYPLVLWIHGGPHGMYDVRFRYEWQNFAANGYVVLFTNPRGSTGYGRSFGNIIQNRYPGRIDFDDLTNGVDAVEERGYIDTNREYVTGCSAGGVLTTWLIAHTQRFAAAAPLCAAPEWIVVMGMSDAPAYVLSRFDTPWWDDPADWLDHSPLMHVGRVQTPTMLITGANDMRIPFGQAEAYYAALKLRGVPSRLIAMADEWHGVTSKPSNFLRLQLYLLDWWNRWPE